MRAVVFSLATIVVASCTAPPTPLGPPDKPPDEQPRVFGPETPAPATRVARLTRVQWENTVRDLFRLDEKTGYSAEVAEDSLPAGSLFDNPADALSVDETQWAGFQRAAALTAQFVTSDQTIMDAVLPADTGDEAARARAFVEDFGLRAHRRPLSATEVDAYIAVYEAGRIGFTAEGVAPFTGGIRLVIEAMLQSPLFLYRVEQSEAIAAGAGADGGDVIPLDGFERATRLSYALWNSMPDD